MRAIVGPVVLDIPEGTSVKLAKRIPIGPSRRREMAGAREAVIAGQRFHDFGRLSAMAVSERPAVHVTSKIWAFNRRDTATWAY